MTFASTMSYVGVLSLAAGLFLVLAGFGVIKIEKVTVTPGPITWGFGITLALVGIFFLLPDIRSLIPSQTSPESQTASNVLAIQTDPTNDWISPLSRPEYMDITEVGISRVDSDNIRFEIRLNESVPQSLTGIHFYGWFLDTDLDSNTGQKYNDIGSDFNVQITYYPDSGWIGQVIDVENVSKWVEIKSIAINDNLVSLTIPLLAIGSPEKLNWISIDQDNEPYYSDIAPNDGHIHTEIPPQ